eukprot:g26581.t1
MTTENQRIEDERAMIVAAREKGTAAKLGVYTKLSGPGWLQSAITLGGGSLAGSLYIGVLLGYQAMWWQPLAMILGIIMLSAIGYVALSTGERPFDAINKHVNPVLGWGWAIATLMANLVWCMPQYSLGTAALQQNLAPDSLGTMDAWVPIGVLFGITGVVIWFYDAGGWGVRVFEWVLKGMVGVVVLSFFAVVVQMTVSGGLDWGAIFAGFIPNFSVFTEPSVEYSKLLSAAGEYRGFWESHMKDEQQRVMIAGAATAVGINMTFLLPYSMLRKGWDRDFRGLAIFDLSTGLFIPYLLATSCVVIAAASQFHAIPAPGLVAEDAESGMKANDNLRKEYNKLLDKRLKKEDGTNSKLQGKELQAKRDALPEGERRLAAMIVKRDAKDLANALQSLSDNKSTSQLVFGIGVLGMAISTIIILMLINGFVITEMIGQSGNKQLHLAGCFLASAVGAIGSNTLWKGEAKTWLAVPTSMFGMVLLPIAYITFLLLMNSKSLLGENRPEGSRRARWNVLMALASAFATVCCVWSISVSGHATVGFSLLGGFIALAVIVHFVRYVCVRAKKPIVVDGKLDDPAWKNAAWTQDFVDIEGDKKPKPRFRTRVKMLWDKNYFYIAAKMEEPHVWGTLTKHDSVIFHDNDFEVFIDPDGDNHNYGEFEINALNTGWDLRLPKPYKDGGKARNDWEIPGLKKAVFIDGTLNDPRDKDRGWNVELAIPWKVLGKLTRMPAPPQEGDQWRVNFSRVEWMHRIVNGKYQKIPNRREDNWVWSPQGVINMHRPETWGYVQFTSKSAAGDTFRSDETDPARQLLHRVYYAQKAFRKTHERWATSLKELKAGVLTHPGFAKPLMLEVNERGFTATARVRRSDGKTVRLRIHSDSRLETE